MTGSSDGQGGLILNVSLDGVVVPPLSELRRSVRQALAHRGDKCATDAELLATELVSNTYEHGHPPIGFRLSLVPFSPVLRIEAEDGDRTGLPRLGVPRLDGERGLGLVLVDHLSLDWGFDVTVTGKVVWADMSCRRLSLVRS